MYGLKPILKKDYLLNVENLISYDIYDYNKIPA